MIRQWRWRIISVGTLLPFIASVEVLLISYFPNSQFAHFAYFDAFITPPPAISHADAAKAAFWLPLLYIPLADWPFLVLASRVRRNIMKRWPNAAAARLSLWGGLIGMTMPYLVGYWGAPLDLAGRGFGPAYFLVFVCPIVGGLLALVGLVIGSANLKPGP